jgi:hypothetical protein
VDAVGEELFFGSVVGIERGLLGGLDFGEHLLGGVPPYIAQSLRRIGFRFGLRAALTSGRICWWLVLRCGLSSVGGLDSSEEAARVQGSVGVALVLYSLHEREGI